MVHCFALLLNELLTLVRVQALLAEFREVFDFLPVGQLGLDKRGLLVHPFVQLAGGPFLHGAGILHCGLIVQVGLCSILIDD